MVDEINDHVKSTGTDLEVLHRIEAAWKRNNPNSNRRNTTKSLDWFRKYIGRSFNRMGTAAIFRDRKLWKQKFQVGKLYIFEYDAKHKDTLPLWDRYPAMFPISSYKAKDGMTVITAINLHYLSPQLRKTAFSALLRLRNEKRYRKQTRLELEWQTLMGLSQSNLFKHAVKSYRLDHVKSVLVEIPSQSWEMVIFLPLARFQKGTRQQAWAGAR